MNVKVSVWTQGAIVKFAFGDKQIELDEIQAQELAGLIYRASKAAATHKAAGSNARTVVVGFEEVLYAHDDPEPYVAHLPPLPPEGAPDMYGDAFVRRRKF